jgi:hypothetical protein
MELKVRYKSQEVYFENLLQLRILFWSSIRLLGSDFNSLRTYERNWLLLVNLLAIKELKYRMPNAK